MLLSTATYPALCYVPVRGCDTLEKQQNIYWQQGRINCLVLAGGGDVGAGGKRGGGGGKERDEEREERCMKRGRRTNRGRRRRRGGVGGREGGGGGGGERASRVDILNDSLLPFTFHTRTLSLTPRGRGGGGGVVSCSREKPEKMHCEEVHIIRTACSEVGPH